MKSSIIAAAAAFSTGVSAFPTIALEAAQNAVRHANVFQAARAAHEKRLNGILPGFNAAEQLIDVSGEHAFVPPNFSAGDMRGPCPGLNALANHNYLPHDGFATIDQFVSATNEVFGMSLDLGLFLSVYGTVMDGNPLSLTPGWSIGGPPTDASEQNLLGNLLGLLGTPDGISGSHNKYETDTSPTRGDLYQYGNDYALQVSQFQTLFDLQPDAATANYNMEVLAQERKITFERSIAENPHFWYGPFTGMAVSQAAHTFIYRFMSNKSAEYPEGVLNQDVLKSFFAITGESGNFTYNPGQERIPENWYKRAIGDEYSILFLETDTLYFASQYPNVLTVGGNTGTVNSFTPLNFDDLTGGVFNATTLLEDNNLACFVYQAAALAAPDILKGLYADITAPLAMLNNATNNALAGLNCPQLASIDADQFGNYPGYATQL
ncbi:Cloroperoxidase [Mollisia scopiformis]|uniref:Cloroperoxidase n=1 Tax=Mollisia scopiformis TaxID=149040 RepID=A0A194X4P0_MOLSC|nr:Cloroperoxidase [Mollisia scopiformis]KUJ15136.1 Cloroperoxidase [Mollisia scopiformis]